MTRSLSLLLPLCLLLAACASGPRFDTEGVDRSLTPTRAAAEADKLGAVPVLWGGVVIASANLEAATQIEVLAYPLDGEQRPDTSRPPLGRFLILKAGYLETAVYAPGRLLTVRGTLAGTREGRIGETRYTYPVVQPEHLYLWPQDEAIPETRLHFGIGIIFHN